ncbi:MAG: hypothetical protein LBE37_09035 [Sphingobacterium sp.]|jgi:hypothetical protein|nr:hypothetical protein [Sphingobacterium sp.]
MKDYQLQIQRIKDKLIEAKASDKDFKVFGADAHQYQLNPPIELKVVEDFERAHHVTIPLAYKLFVTQVGNGGSSYNNSGAGPFYGLYRFGEHFSVSYNDYADEQIQAPTKAYPGMSIEEWEKEVDYMDQAGDNDAAFEQREAALWGGFFILGTQGCTFHHALILNGPHTGRICNIDDGDRQMPQFSFEEDFLDWYERWLDDVIEGNLSDRNSGSFGYQMGGKEESLLALFEDAYNITVKQEALRGLLFKKKLTAHSLSQLQRGFINQPHAIQELLVELFLTNDYAMAVSYLETLFKTNINRTVKLIHWYAKEHKMDWLLRVKESLDASMDEETFRFACYILRDDPEQNFEVLKPFVHHENPDIRSQVFYTFSFLEDKSNYEAEFLIGLNESNKSEIVIVLQSLGDFKTKAILKKLQELAYKFPYTVQKADEDGMVYFSADTDDLVYITSNLERALEKYGLDHETVKTVDLECIEIREQ